MNIHGVVPKEIIDNDTLIYLVYRNEWEAELAMARLPQIGSRLVCYNGYYNAVEIDLLKN